MPEEGTVLLVESDDGERERLGEALEQAGYQVIACPGPGAPDYTCIGGREGYCPLLERADVVVLDPWLAGDEMGVGTSPDELFALYAGSGRAVVAIDAVRLDPIQRGNMIRLDRHPEPRAVVAAVRVAAEADGFVLRRPLGEGDGLLD
jgi:CheY-like chemotaxis protein